MSNKFLRNLTDGIAELQGWTALLFRIDKNEVTDREEEGALFYHFYFFQASVISSCTFNEHAWHCQANQVQA